MGGRVLKSFLTSPPGDSDARQSAHSTAFRILLPFPAYLQFLLINCLRIALFFSALKTRQMEKEGFGGGRDKDALVSAARKAQRHPPASLPVPA